MWNSLLFPGYPKYEASHCKLVFALNPLFHSKFASIASKSTCWCLYNSELASQWVLHHSSCEVPCPSQPSGYDASLCCLLSGAVATGCVSDYVMLVSAPTVCSNFGEGAYRSANSCNHQVAWHISHLRPHAGYILWSIPCYYTRMCRCLMPRP